MSAVSSIEWTDRTWNPVRGCSRVSPGCDNCYAMRVAHRFSGEGGTYEGLTVLRPKTAKRPGVDWAGTARLVTDQITAPVGWRKPQRIFVNSMSDLFHESLEDWRIDRIFGTMWACLYLGRDGVPGHTFQILTKRPQRMRDYLSTDRRRAWADAAVLAGGGIDPDGLHDQTAFHKGPHPRIWLGVSVENQATADDRIPLLLETPAAVRFISAEPLLGDTSIWAYLKSEVRDRSLAILGGAPLPGLDWVIVGGESGPGARPFNVAWAADVVKQCRDAGVACFVKQLGSVPVIDAASWCISPWSPALGRADDELRSRGLVNIQLLKRKGGDMSEWPSDLRVREFPNATNKGQP